MIWEPFTGGAGQSEGIDVLPLLHHITQILDSFWNVSAG
jgi:hypothetical protein